MNNTMSNNQQTKVETSTDDDHSNVLNQTPVFKSILTDKLSNLPKHMRSSV